jgi:hypothetical protein
VAWETPRQLVTRRERAVRVMAPEYFMDFDRLVGLSTRVWSISGQPAQISTEFQSRLAELTREQTKTLPANVS